MPLSDSDRVTIKFVRDLRVSDAPVIYTKDSEFSVHPATAAALLLAGVAVMACAAPHGGARRGMGF